MYRVVDSGDLLFLCKLTESVLLRMLGHLDDDYDLEISSISKSQKFVISNTAVKVVIKIYGVGKRAIFDVSSRRFMYTPGASPWDNT